MKVWTVTSWTSKGCLSVVPSLGFYLPLQSLPATPTLNITTHMPLTAACHALLPFTYVSESAHHLPSPNFTLPSKPNIFWRVSSDVFFSRNVLWASKSGSGFHSPDSINTQDISISHCTKLMVCMSNLFNTVWASWGPSLCFSASLYPGHSHLVEENLSDWINEWMTENLSWHHDYSAH